MVKKWADKLSSTPRLLLSLVNKPEKKGENRPTFSHKALRISRAQKHRDKFLCLSLVIKASLSFSQIPQLDWISKHF